jgi:hypothetical protein
MKWSDNIKARIGRQKLEGKTVSAGRKINLCKLSEAKKIGILYNATEYVSFEIVRDLVKKLTTNTVTFSVLGYVDSKKLIDNYLYRKGFDFFCKNDLNWYYKPVSPQTDQFINEPFDILINLSLDYQFPIHYISSASKATFKTGKYSETDTSLDFMIDIEKEKETMKSLNRDIIREKKSIPENNPVAADIEKRTEIEFQLKFLIDQLLHYLSILKKYFLWRKKNLQAPGLPLLRLSVMTVVSISNRWENYWNTLSGTEWIISFPWVPQENLLPFPKMKKRLLSIL